MGQNWPLIPGSPAGTAFYFIFVDKGAGRSGPGGRGGAPNGGCGCVGLMIAVAFLLGALIAAIASGLTNT